MKKDGIMLYLNKETGIWDKVPKPYATIHCTTKEDYEFLEAAVKHCNKHARWIETCVPDVYQCSHCKKVTKMDELCDSEILRAFCPNCGVKMDLQTLIDNGSVESSGKKR